MYLINSHRYGGIVVLPIASYPLANDSDEVIGTTSGIDGVDTNISYDGTEATFNGSTSKIVIPDNDIFSFTDGANDLPFSIECEVNINSWGIDGATLLEKRSAGNVGEWAISINESLKRITFILISSSGSMFYYIDNAVELNTDYNFRLTYDGNGLTSSGKIFINNIEQSILSLSTGYTNMVNSNIDVIVGKRDFDGKYNLDGTMKNLKFYNYEKLT